MWPLGWLAMLVWIAALLLMVWLVVRTTAGDRGEDALEILGARFARGEISQVEYEQARDALLRDQE